MNYVDPKIYFIHLEPDIETFSFTAKLKLGLEAKEPMENIVLNAKDLAIWNCNIKVDGVLVPCSFSVNTEKENLSIALPEAISGGMTVDIEYSGKINDLMAGFYRSGYMENGSKRYIAVTQFQESDARRAFPCMDQPLKKAVFEIEIVVPKGLSAVSNTLVRECRRLEDGKTLFRFFPTPKMSTYLVFFGIGDFDRLRDELDARVSVLALPGRSKYGSYGVEFGRKSLQFCETYFDIPYPLPKLDLLAIPDFAFGAMENWGAVTFRENLLLYYPETTSKAGLQRIYEVTAHEIVHQWFGNLVTPSDWKYIWLNESFATYFSYGVVDDHFPEWETWSHFILGQTHSALSRDELVETQAIEIPGDIPVVINASTAPIIYSKGGSILRQVEGFIGKKSFQDGLRRYLNTHAYGCTASLQLWEAFDAVSGKDVSSMMKSWVEQPGHPIVSVHRDGNKLSLKQSRFTCLQKEFTQTWQIPITVTVFETSGNTKQITHLMNASREVIDLGADVESYKVNTDQTGFYRVLYESDSDIMNLTGLVADKTLSDKDRWGLQHDLYALVKSGRVGMDRYLTFLENYMTEDAFLPLSSIGNNLYHAYLVLNDDRKKEIAELGGRIFENALDRMGLEPDPDEPLTVSILRDQLIYQASVFGKERITAFAQNCFKRLTDGESVHADILKSALQVGAMTGGPSELQWIENSFETAGSEHERMNLLAALACVSDGKLIRDVLEFCLNKVPSRNRFMPISAMAGNLSAIPILWKWFDSHIEQLGQMHPLHLERVITALVPMCGLYYPEAVRSFFQEYVKKNPRVKDAVTLALEKLSINIQMREA
jgi:tricorn protease interacting factor F2/3